MNIKNLSILFLFLSNHFLTAQIISGHLFDTQNNEPLIGATLYLDGTTIGTTSDFDGYFELDLKESKNALLIISFLGYETKTFQINSKGLPKKIYLSVNQNKLDVVTIEPDKWRRERKLQIFKSEFLGRSSASKYCKIINEKDITLIYKASNNTLIAYSDKPIIIKNKYLGYQITYDLVDFEVQFNYDSMGLRHTKKVYYSGTSYFTELNKKTRKQILKNRINEYEGSLIHFMHSLANYRLTENKFSIYFNRFQVSPYKYFNITENKDGPIVKILKEKLSVLYDQFDQSSIEFSEGHDTFFIDNLGNHSPPNSLVFGGEFGKKRIANMLPLNYFQSQKN